jgi:hypothetical protein
MTQVIHDPETDWCACQPAGNTVCDYRLLADAVIEHLNPPDDDVAEVSLCITAVKRAAAYVASLPCTCEPGYDHEPCARCNAIGQWHRKPWEYRIRSDESIGRPEDIPIPWPPLSAAALECDDENLVGAAGCHAQIGVRDDRSVDCGGLLICDLDTDHKGPHYCAAEEIWWLPGGSAERHDPTFECRPIHSEDTGTDEPRWIGPEAY